VVFVIMMIIVVGGVILSVANAIWRARVLSRGGLNPFVAKEQLEVQLTNNLRNNAAPPPAPPAKTIEERLVELDDLHERGVITDEERAAGRAKIIGGD
jgi:hypothetical protein